MKWYIFRRSLIPAALVLSWGGDTGARWWMLVLYVRNQWLWMDDQDLQGKGKRLYRFMHLNSHTKTFRLSPCSFTKESVSDRVIMLPDKEVVDWDVGHLGLSSIRPQESQPVLGGNHIVWVGGGLSQFQSIEEFLELLGGQGENVLPYHRGFPLVAVCSSPAEFTLAAVMPCKVTCRPESTNPVMLQLSHYLPECISCWQNSILIWLTSTSASLVEELGGPSLSVIDVSQAVRSSPGFAVDSNSHAASSPGQRATSVRRIWAQSRAALLGQDALDCAAHSRKLSLSRLQPEEKTKKSETQHVQHISPVGFLLSAAANQFEHQLSALKRSISSPRRVWNLSLLWPPVVYLQIRFSDSFNICGNNI